MTVKINKQSYSEQIALDMEKAIRSGVYVPEQRLPPVRELAEQYGVSRQAINSALLSLQHRGLLNTHPRIGTFVNMSAVFPAARQLSTFQEAMPTWTPDYISDQLILAPPLYPGTQICTHMLPHGTGTSVLFDYELERIVNSRPDVLLVAIPMMKRRQLKRLLGLSFPVVLIGDLHDRSLYDLDFNMIRVDTADRSRYLVRAARENGARDLVMVGARETVYYGNLLAEGARREAEASGLALRYYGLDGDDIHDEAQRREACDALVRQMRADGAFDALLLDYDSVTRYLPPLAALGLVPGRDVLVVANYNELHPGTVRVAHHRRPFAEKAAAAVQSLYDRGDKPLGIMTISHFDHSFWVKIDACSFAAGERREAGHV